MDRENELLLKEILEECRNTRNKLDEVATATTAQHVEISGIKEDLKEYKKDHSNQIGRLYDKINPVEEHVVLMKNAGWVLLKVAAGLISVSGLILGYLKFYS